MIFSLRGTIIEKKSIPIVLEVNGIGYEVLVSIKSLAILPKVGEETFLYISPIIREDSHTLYGFISKEERSLFKELIKINGIGPKLALSIMSSLSALELGSLISTENISALVKIPGIGRKTANMLVLSLKDTVSKLGLNDVSTIDKQLKSNVEDAISALVALGYNRSEVSKLLSEASLSEDASCEDIIKLVLKKTSK